MSDPRVSEAVSTPLVTRPSVAHPYRYLDVYGGAGYIYFDPEAGHWIVEHCHDGYWGGCAAGIEAEDLHRVVQRTIGHLERAKPGRAHRMKYPTRLAGVTHAPWPKP